MRLDQGNTSKPAEELVDGRDRMAQAFLFGILVSHAALFAFGVWFGSINSGLNCISREIERMEREVAGR
jgi:hypothetical protein